MVKLQYSSKIFLNLSSLNKILLKKYFIFISVIIYKNSLFLLLNILLYIYNRTIINLYFKTKRIHKTLITFIKSPFVFKKGQQQFFLMYYKLQISFLLYCNIFYNISIVRKGIFFLFLTLYKSSLAYSNIYMRSSVEEYYYLPK